MEPSVENPQSAFAVAVGCCAVQVIGWVWQLNEMAVVQDGHSFVGGDRSVAVAS